MPTPVPPAVVVTVAREQGGIPTHKARCIYCRKRYATDPHHWLFKRSSGISRSDDDIPEEALHHPFNIVLLCRQCHDLFGQTTSMAINCYRWKEALGVNILEWVETLVKQGTIRNRPTILYAIVNGVV